jgi:uncharacterized membrane protein YfcA
MPPEKKPVVMSVQVVLILVIIGLASGMLSGLVGVGGGIIIVPALVFFLGFTQHQAQGTSLGLLMLPVGILAVLNYYRQGYVDFKVIAIMSIAFVAGGWLGSKLSLVVLSDEIVKRIFAVILFYAAFKMMGWDKAILNLFR